MNNAGTNAGNRIVAVGGDALSAGIAVLGTLTGRTKPFHPRGDLRSAVLTRFGVADEAPRTGSAWIDEPGTDRTVIRLSGGLGLPRGWPDIHGLAMALDPDGSRADLLFASTGTGTVSRHVLVPTRDATARPLTALFPYRSPSGPVYLGAEPDGGENFLLTWAAPKGSWHAFGRLEVQAPLGSGDEVTFDPVLHVPDGLAQYDWVRLLREPSYLTARARSGRAAA